ncbi:hypothetical protein O181_041605 [Austropuccinia psidii MF-1]|uniref:Uncharacterized protein n=1 Tax=Austropuccinia psidii MF-1 TaxID=1389203 RepID=A0A9Q3DJ02_9BASI|nr:hypothetical protein [Austropuccinia psidii MF-1]
MIALILIVGAPPPQRDWAVFLTDCSSSAVIIHTDSSRMKHISQEEIHSIRLITRLGDLSDKQLRPWCEKATGSEQAGETNSAGSRHWELKALQTTIQLAMSRLDEMLSDPIMLKTISSFQDPEILRQKLFVSHKKVQSLIQNFPPPNSPSPLPSPIFNIKEPELPLAPAHVPSLAIEAASKVQDEKLGRLDELGSEEKSKKPELLTPETILRKHASVQDELTDELSQMASQLKKNIYHFNHLLAEDQAVLLANQTKLERNSELMKKEGGRLGETQLNGFLVQATWLRTTLSISLKAT